MLLPLCLPESTSVWFSSTCLRQLPPSALPISFTISFKWLPVIKKRGGGGGNTGLACCVVPHAHRPGRTVTVLLPHEPKAEKVHDGSRWRAYKEGKTKFLSIGSSGSKETVITSSKMSLFIFSLSSSPSYFHSQYHDPTGTSTFQMMMRK